MTEFAEFIGNASSPQLLCLAFIPFTGAVILGVYLAFALSRRRKQSKMKHGFQLKPAAMEKEAAIEAINDLDAPILSSPSPSVAPIDELDLDVLTKTKPSPTSPGDASTPLGEINLDMDVLNRKADMEALAMDAPERSDEEKIGIPAQPVELLSLLRDPQSGQLIVEIAGQHYSKLTDVSDMKIGQFILKLVAHLLVFTNGVIATEAGVKSVYTPKKLGEVPLPPFRAPTPVSQLPDPMPEAPSSTPTPPEQTPTEAEPEPLIPRPSAEAEAAFWPL